MNFSHQLIVITAAWFVLESVRFLLVHLFPLICLVLCNHESIVKEDIEVFLTLQYTLSLLVGINATVFWSILKYNIR